MATSSPGGAPVPTLGDAPNVPADLLKLATFLDSRSNIKWVDDGVTPAFMYDGIVVAEKTSGKVWIGQKSGASYNKKYVIYPYYIESHGAASILNNNATVWGWDVPSTSLYVNSSAADFDASNFFIVPITGVWSIKVLDDWTSNSTGYRSLSVSLDGAYYSHYIDSKTAVNGTNTPIVVMVNRRFTAGTVIGAKHQQTSGGTLSLNTWIEATLVSVDY